MKRYIVILALCVAVFGAFSVGTDWHARQVRRTFVEVIDGREYLTRTDGMYRWFGYGTMLYGQSESRQLSADALEFAKVGTGYIMR